MTKVLWSVPLERAIYDRAAASLMSVAQHAGSRGYGRIIAPYMRTDTARNIIARSFLKETADADDMLVMLDADHEHPHDIITQLVESLVANPEIGVLGGLYFRRSSPFDPLFFKRMPGDGHVYMMPGDYEDNSLYECDHVGTGVMAIRRWVFDKLAAFAPFYFRYDYPDGIGLDDLPGEDTYFARICEQVGVPHYVHTGIFSGHLSLRTITRAVWENEKHLNTLYRDALAAGRVVTNKQPANYAVSHLEA